MATGLIGTSKISVNNAAITTTGTTLSYTAPASGISYAVVSVNAAVSASTFNTNGNISCRAGTCAASVTYATSSVASANSNSYSVILAPGQTWSDFTEIFSQGASGNAQAFLQASVLEVV